MPYHRPDPQATVAANIQPAEFGELVQIHDDRWLGQTKVHHWDETLTAGQQFGGCSMMTHNVQGFCQSHGSDILERSRFHKSDVS